MMSDPRTLRCWAEIDFNALRGNLAWLRHRAGPQVKLLTVVKADAYGHGLGHIAALLMQSGTDIFGVANLSEASAIRTVGRGWPILMLGACLPHEFETCVREDVMPTVSRLEEAQAFSTVAGRLGKAVRVHLKIDTGMGRLGAQPEEALEIAAGICKLPHLVLDGVYTHFSSAEDDAVFTRTQRERFQTVLDQLRAHGIHVPYIHANNSAGILLEPASMFDLIRPGLLVYGIVPPGARTMPERQDPHLRPALSWKARLALVKEIPKGTPISYGQSFVTEHNMRVGTVTCGYGDGYLRSASNRAQVLIQGKGCRVLGRVTMDQMLVDLSEVASTQPGEEVVLIGRQGEREITAIDLAEACSTVPWEILTSINYRVPRIYRGASAA